MPNNYITAEFFPQKVCDFGESEFRETVVSNSHFLPPCFVLC